MPAKTFPQPHHQRLFGAALCWLVAGSTALLTTLVPMHNALFGWSPMFWLVGAPLAILLALEPSLPRQLLRRRRPRRPARDRPVWH